MSDLVEFAHNLITELHGALSEEAAVRLHKAADELAGPIEPEADPYDGKPPDELLAMASEGDEGAYHRYVAVLKAKSTALAVPEATAGR